MKLSIGGTVFRLRLHTDYTPALLHGFIKKHREQRIAPQPRDGALLDG